MEQVFSPPLHKTFAEQHK